MTIQDVEAFAKEEIKAMVAIGTKKSWFCLDDSTYLMQVDSNNNVLVFKVRDVSAADLHVLMSLRYEG